MTSVDYQELNKFFDAFTIFTPLSRISSDIDVVTFGVIHSKEQGIPGELIPRKWGEDVPAEWEGFDPGRLVEAIPKEWVEASAKRYFGVEKINHEAVDSTEYSFPAYRNGYYRPGGQGYLPQEWCNVSKFVYNGDGTYTATVDLYQCYPSNGTEAPRNRYDQREAWVLDGKTKVVDGGSDFDTNIHRTATDTVVLRPFIYGNEKTWQVVGVNGYNIPKQLLGG
ncbi:MAG: hypothetical protein FWG24_01630 [Eggerthellaceae bacterium]|nr:hypothetical protein [Eggerthellaceae bacterium]MDR2721958.1 hypothetical protein [Coriobacteriaceae bacterium]